jgi:hypothetical protein
MTPRLSDCWSVAAFRATPRPGKRLFSAIIGEFTTSATGLPVTPRMLRTSPRRVFIKMYRTLNTYDSGKGAFMTWVTTITRNLLVDHFRKSKGDRITDSLDSDALRARGRAAA